MKDQIEAWITADGERFTDFVRRFVRAASPNPPGDTLAAMSLVRELLDDAGADYTIRARDPVMPNLIAAQVFAAGDKHLVLNGHIDVFPVETASAWSHAPWEAEVHEGKIYGRGVADMKVGTAASIFTYIYLHRLARNLKGKLSLTVVSDEETLGPNGANFLFEEYEDEVLGTACLNGEPSSKYTVRFGEKGNAWIRFLITTPGGHSAYPHHSPNAIDLAYNLIADLRKFTQFPFQEPPEYAAVMDSSAATFDLANGPGASKLARSILVGVGTINGGAKVNMIPARCEFDVDFRLPNGVNVDDLLAHIHSLRAQHTFEYTILKVTEPNWCEPDGELATIVRRNAQKVTGIEPASVVGMANTDARLWRYRNVPAVVYGPSPIGMGSVDENVPIGEALDILRVHALSAYDYLKG